MQDAPVISSWNLELVSFIKEFTFDAGLPSILLVLSCLLLWLCIFRKFVKLMFTCASFLIILFCYKGTPNFLAKPLLSEEGRKLQEKIKLNKDYVLIPDPLPKCTSDINGIVVLGAGIYQKGVPGIYSQIRLLGLSSLLHLSKNDEKWLIDKTPIVFTGGNTNPNISQSEASAMKDFTSYLYGNKINDFFIITENKSKNTYQNSAYTREIFDKNNFNKNIILITSSTHMFRAQLTFEKQGFRVCPVPVASLEVEGSGLFNFNNARKSVEILNEYFGIAGYIIKGWIDIWNAI